MKTLWLKPLVTTLLLLVALMAQTQNSEEIKLIIRADDMGFCNAANQACILGYKEGIITDVEVLVPGAWFLDAAEMLRANPGLDVGVHLALTSEWTNFKFGPITNAPDLTTEDGYFPGTVDEMLALNAGEEAIKKEFRAQIELALKHIPQVSHLSTHMFWHNAHGSIEKIINELSEEYELPINFPLVSVSNFWAVEPEKKEDALVAHLDTITGGVNVFILHPALLNDETKAIKGAGMDPDVRMGIHRQNVTNAVISERIMALIDERKIKLISFKSIIE